MLLERIVLSYPLLDDFHMLCFVQIYSNSCGKGWYHFHIHNELEQLKKFDYEKLLLSNSPQNTAKGIICCNH